MVLYKPQGPLSQKQQHFLVTLSIRGFMTFALLKLTYILKIISLLIAFKFMDIILIQIFVSILICLKYYRGPWKGLINYCYPMMIKHIKLK